MKVLTTNVCTRRWETQTEKEIRNRKVKKTERNTAEFAEREKNVIKKHIIQINC